MRQITRLEFASILWLKFEVLSFNQLYILEPLLEFARLGVHLLVEFNSDLVQLFLCLNAELLHDWPESNVWRFKLAIRLIFEVMWVILVGLHNFELTSLQLSSLCVFKFVNTFSDGFFADMHGASDLGRSSPEAVVLGGDEDGCAAQTVRPAAFCHPATIHRLDESNSRVFNITKFVAKIELQTKLLDVKRWVNDRNDVLFQQDLASEKVEDLCDFE